MLSTIVRKELRDFARDGRFRWVAATVLVLSVLGLASGWQYRGSSIELRSAAEQTDEASWLGQGKRNPHSAAHFARYAFKPTPPLTYFDRGINRYVGEAVWLEAHSQDPFEFRQAEDTSTALRFGELTAAWTLQYLLPLLIVILGFGTIAGERESGTLRQLASLGVRPSTLATGKMLGVATAMGLVLAPAFVVGAGLLALAGGTNDLVVRGTGLLVVYTLYLAAFVGVTFWVSARARSARSALVALLGFWVIVVLVVPRLAADFGEWLHPSPSSAQFHDALGEELEAAKAAGADFERQLLARYGVSSRDELPISYAGARLQASEERSNPIFDEHFGRLWATYERQGQVHAIAGLLSPMILTRDLSMALAGTDVAHHRHFADAAEQHRRVFIKFLNDDMTANAVGADFAYVAGHELWASAPRFDYRAPEVGEALRPHATSLALLVGWAGLAFAGAVTATRRLRVV